MVRVYGANLSDVTDRYLRKLGIAYGYQDITKAAIPVPMAGNDGVSVSPKPWWCHHGQGEILLWDDFNGALQWLSTLGTLSRASDQGCILVGDYSAKLVTGTTAGNTANMIKYTSPLIDEWEYHTLELWWMLYTPAATTPRSIEVDWDIHKWNGSTARRFAFRYLANNSGTPTWKPQYFDSTGAWVDLWPVAKPIQITNPQWHHLLIQVRCPTGAPYEYDFIQHDQVAYDLGGVAGYTQSYDRGQTIIQITATTDVALATTAYVGAVIVNNGNYGYPGVPGPA